MSSQLSNFTNDDDSVRNGSRHESLSQHSMESSLARSMAAKQPSTHRRQGKYWLLTIPESSHWVPELPIGVAFCKGQKEKGERTDHLHWQVFCITITKCSVACIKGYFRTACHAELTYSKASEDYVWKESTRVPDTQFEFGAKPFQRNSAIDWQVVWDAAQRGDWDAIPVQIRICHYRSIRTIMSDFMECPAIERSVVVYWGKTGTGKSRRAWEEAMGQGRVYCKDPCTKFWCGYQGQKYVVCDEFRGLAQISHLLRWFDRYPCRVELKGSSFPLMVEKFWLTSNLHPRDWYPDLDEDTKDAFVRRLEIIEI
nr:MAG: replication associated protein [Cressdnaviricota sp.]